MADKKDYYDILGLNQQASEVEIKKAYKKLAMKHHPDRNDGNPESTETFKEVKKAYDILSDPQKSGLPGEDKIIDAIGGAAGISTLGLPKWLISKLMQGGVKSNLAQKYNQLAKENRLRDARQLLTANSPYMGEDPSISSAKRIMREVPTAPSKSRWEIKQSLNQGGSAGSGLNYLLGEDDQNVRTPYGGLPGLLGE